MTISAPPERDVLYRSERKSIGWLAGFFEAAASLMALYAIGALLINKADTTVAFFGETPTVTSDNVSTYHRWLTTVAVAVSVSFIAALWRKGRASRWLYWHGLVLLAGLFAAAAFHVAVQTPDPAPGPVQDRPGSACRSGGDNSECVGG